MPKKSKQPVKKYRNKKNSFASKKKQVFKNAGTKKVVKKRAVRKGEFALPNPMTFDTNIRSGKNHPIIEKRYLFSKGVDKAKVDAAIKEELYELLRSKGSLSFQVSYMIDKNYSSGFLHATKKSDIAKMSFSNNMFRDYSDEEIYDHHTKILEAGIFLIEEKTKHSKKMGCTDGFNDCLYEAILQGFKEEKPEILESPERFKDWLRVGRTETVHIKKIPKIEKKLKMNINVCGSHQYQNKKIVYPKSMTIRIWKSHVERVFAVDEYKDIKKGYNEFFKGRKYPIFYKKNHVDGTIKLCRLEGVKDGKCITWQEDLSYLDKFYSYKKLADQYFLKQVDSEKEKNEEGKTVYVTPEPEDIIQSKIDEWVMFQRATYQQLKGRARGACNMFRCNGHYRVAALQYWYMLLPKSINCDPYLRDYHQYLSEEFWLRSSMTGSLTYAEKDVKLTNVYEYDVNSMYGSIMCNMDFITRQGEFAILFDLPEKIKKKDYYNIYRCKITDFDPKVFQKNIRGDFYTGFDVKTAQEEGYKIELIRDGLPNVLMYNKNCRVRGEEVFGQFVRDMYLLKSTGVECAKVVMNSLWGSLCMRVLKEYNTLNGNINIEDPILIHSMFYRCEKGGKRFYAVKVYEKHDMQNSVDIRIKQFRYKMARFGPFLLALGRRMMYSTIRGIREHVKYVHTDGFLCTEQLDLPISKKLGEWKVNEYKSAHIIHQNRVVKTV